MGANQSCCAYSTPRTGSKKDKNRKEVERQDDKYEPRQVSDQIAKDSESRPDERSKKPKYEFDFCVGFKSGFWSHFLIQM